MNSTNNNLNDRIKQTSKMLSVEQKTALYDEACLFIIGRMNRSSKKLQKELDTIKKNNPMYWNKPYSLLLQKILSTREPYCEKCGCTEMLCGHNKRGKNGTY